MEAQGFGEVQAVGREVAPSGEGGELDKVKDSGRGIWQDLRKHIAVLASVDQASKAQALQSLSIFLSRLAARISGSAISGSSGCLESAVSLWTDDIMLLQDWLCGELTKHTQFLGALGSREAGLLGVNIGNEHRLSSQDVTTQTLRCCIRILPLIECLDTGLSANCALVLRNILQQLCSPVMLHNVLENAFSATKVRGEDSLPEQSMDTDHREAYLRHMYTVEAEQSLLYAEKISVYERSEGPENLCCQGRRWQQCEAYREVKVKRKIFDKSAAWACPRSQDLDGLHLSVSSMKQVNLICAMLEVYMDELLLCPDLSEVILGNQDEEESCALSFSKQMGIVMEASFVHVLLSLLWRDEEPVRPPCLTLPAGVLLWDIATLDGAPRLFLSHIANLVAESLHTLLPRSIFLPRHHELMENVPGIAADANGLCFEEGRIEYDRLLELVEGGGSWSLSKLVGGGMDWSRMAEERAMFSSDSADMLPPRICLGLALSILESAVRLYGQVFAPRCVEGKAFDVQLSQSSMFTACLYKYRALGTLVGLNAGVAVEGVSTEAGCALPETEACNCHSCWGGSPPPDARPTAQRFSSLVGHFRKDCHRNSLLYRFRFSQSEYEVATSGAAGQPAVERFMDVDDYKSVEQSRDFMASILHLISAAVYRISAEFHSLKQLAGKRGSTSEVEACEEIRSISSCISAVFKLLLQRVDLKSAPASSPVTQPGEPDFKDIVGGTLKVFGTIVSSEMKAGLADHLAREYFHVLKSLAVLLHEAGTEAQASAKSAECPQPAAVDGTFLEESSSMFSSVDSGGNSENAGGHVQPGMVSVFPRASTLKILQKIRKTRSREDSISKDQPSSAGSDQLQKTRKVDPPQTLSSDERPDKHPKTGSTEDGPVLANGALANPFVQTCVAYDKFNDGDNFDDLNDFIVCKKDRNYVQWRKQRQKCVQRSRTRSIWKRMEERRELLAKLLLTEME